MSAVIHCRVTITNSKYSFPLDYHGFGVDELRRMWEPRLQPGETLTVEQVT